MRKVKSTFYDFIVNLYFVACLWYFFPGIFAFISKTNHLVAILVVTAGFTLTSFTKLNTIGKRLSTKTKSKFWVWQFLAILLVTIIVGWQVVEVNPTALIKNFKSTYPMLSKLFSPRTKYFYNVLEAITQTLFLALTATVLAIIPAFVLSFAAARNLMPRTILGNIIYYLVRTLATFIRSIEAIVWAIIFTVWVGIGPFAGMLALMIHSVAALTKLYSEQIENIDNGPVEAITATGASRLAIWIYAVIPQILSPFLAFTIYRWDINVRMATIVGFVGGGGIGLLLKQQQDLMRWRDVGLIMLCIAAIVWLMDIFSAKVRQKLSD